jgi:hypothetical protein
MGVDISLRSQMNDDLYCAIVEREAEAAKLRENQGPDAVIGYMNAIYKALEDTGNYYREGYNRFGLLPHLGLSWHDDVAPLLSEDRTLPINAARHFLVELESRPVSPAMTDTTHERAGPMEKLVESEGMIEPPTADDIDHEATFEHLVRKRKVLIALLRRSIETNEPLDVSL